MTRKNPWFWLVVVLCVPVLAYAIFVAAFFAYSRPDPSGARFTSDFDTGNLSEWNQLGAKQLCCDHSAQVTLERARSSPYSVRFEVRPEDPLVKGSIRAEFRLKSVPWHTAYEYDFSTFLPADWQTDDIPVTIVQWHNVNDLYLLEQNDVVPLRIAIVGEEYWIISHWDRRRVSRFPGQPTTVDGYKVLAKLPIDRGHWADWRFRVRWSVSSDGRIDVWKDGKLLGYSVGPSAFNDTYTPYFKIGLYVPGWAGGRRSAVTERVMFVDDIRQTEIGG